MKLQPLPSPCLKKQFYNVGRHFYICLIRATLTRTNNVRAGWWGVRLQGGGAAGEGEEVPRLHPPNQEHPRQVSHPASTSSPPATSSAG